MLSGCCKTWLQLCTPADPGCLLALRSRQKGWEEEGRMGSGAGGTGQRWGQGGQMRIGGWIRGDSVCQTHPPFPGRNTTFRGAWGLVQMVLLAQVQADQPAVRGLTLEQAHKRSLAPGLTMGDWESSRSYRSPVLSSCMEWKAAWKQLLACQRRCLGWSLES